MKARQILGAILVTLGAAAIPGRSLLAQEVYSPADLTAMENQLEQKAGATGLATETVKKYATDYTMLAYRSQSGQAELHEKFADFFVVLDGNATLVTGGHIVNPKTTAPGEVRGDSVQDGKETTLKKGDLVHIPPNTPHQLVLPKGATFQYFIVKVQEVD